MAKPATRFAEILTEVDPRKVADLVDRDGVGVALRRYTTIGRLFIHRVAEEGRRMKASGETWSKPERKAA